MNPEKTIGKLFLRRTKSLKNKNAIGWIENDQVRFLNAKEYRKIIEALTLSIVKLGAPRGTKFSILASTCKEWHFCDLAILCSGGAVVPVHPNFPPGEINYVLQHSESSVLIVEDSALLGKIRHLLPESPKIECLIHLTPLTPELKAKIPPRIRVFFYDDLIKEGMESLEKKETSFEQLLEKQTPQEVATIVYSSGTSGMPRGAVITHNAFVTTLFNIKDFSKGAFSEADRCLVFLPLSHIFGRVDSMLPLVFDWEVVFTSSLERLMTDISLVRPTVMLMVPRIFEKIFRKIEAQMEESGLLYRKFFSWAERISTAYHEKIQLDFSPAPEEILKYKLVRRFFYSRFQRFFGGRIRYFVSGGSYLDPQIHKFMRNMGFTILEGYGLTETIAPCALNPLSKQIPGTVGIPIGDVQIKFTSEQEILIKTEGMFSGYYKEPEKTRETVTDGWFHSGDIGKFNSEGYLEILGRKWDLITTPEGKKIFPQKIESSMKSRFINHFLVVGNGRPFLVGVVGLEKEGLLPYISRWNLPLHLPIAELIQTPQVYDLVKNHIDETNKKLSPHEQIKKFLIFPEEFSVESGHLTPTLKVRKTFILNQLGPDIDSLYQE